MQVVGIEDAVEVVAGTEHNCARHADGRASCWGQIITGRLGSGSTVLSAMPLAVLNIRDATEISAGEGHTCAVQNQGELWCWGRNNYGQLGVGDRGDQHTARRVEVLGRGRSITAGMFHSCALRTDGVSYCWGYNNFGQLGTPSDDNTNVPAQVVGVPRSTAIDAGWTNACALASSGLISCWGGSFGDTPELLCDESFPVELCGCSNGIDDDLDGDIDRLDSECATDRACLGLECVPPTNFLPEFFSQRFFADPLTRTESEAGSCGGAGTAEMVYSFRPPNDGGYVIRANSGSPEVI